MEEDEGRVANIILGGTVLGAASFTVCVKGAVFDLKPIKLGANEKLPISFLV